MNATKQESNIPCLSDFFKDIRKVRKHEIVRNKLYTVE